MLEQTNIPIDNIFSNIEIIGKITKFEGIQNMIKNISQISLDETVSNEERIKLHNIFLFNTNKDLENNQDIAQSITEELFNEIKDIKTRRDIIQKIDQYYGHIARLWTPLLFIFLSSVMRIAKGMGIQYLYLMTRDSLPFSTIAFFLSPEFGFEGKVKLVELSRKMLGITDGFLGSFLPGSMIPISTPIRRYIRRLFFRKQEERVALIDVGTYGTIVWALTSVKRLYNKPTVFFFNSSNSGVWGFLNHVINYANLIGKPIDPDVLWILGDTIESFPKPYDSPQFFIKEHNPVVMVKPRSYIEISAAFSLYWHFVKECRKIKHRNLDPIIELKKLINTCTKEKRATNLLPRYVKDWRLANKFFQHLWRAGKTIPPQIDLI